MAARDDEFCLLFDNDDDPFQLRNLFGSSEHLALRKDLHDELERMILRSGEDVPEFVRLRDPDQPNRSCG